MIHGTLKHFLEDMLDIAGYAKKEKETYVVSLENTLREAVAIELLKKFPKDDADVFTDFITRHKKNPRIIQEFFKSLSTKEEFVQISTEKTFNFTLEIVESFLLSASEQQRKRVKHLIERYNISRIQTRTVRS